MVRRPSLPMIARIDMTPMAGVLTGLIILFLVITPIGGHGVEVEIPQISASWPSASDDAEAAAVGVSHRGTLFFRGRRLDGGPEELGVELRQRFEGHPGASRVVRLKADIHSRFADVQAIARVCRDAGATDIQFIAESKPEPWPW